jgi:hypothetical protein
LDHAGVFDFFMGQNLVIKNDQFAPPFHVAALGRAFDWKTVGLLPDFLLVSGGLTLTIGLE